MLRLHVFWETMETSYYQRRRNGWLLHTRALIKVDAVSMIGCHTWVRFLLFLYYNPMKKRYGANHHDGTGKRIVELQLSTALVSMPRNPTQVEGPDEYGRVPFDHPALDGVLNLSELTKSEILDKARLFRIARSHNLEGVVRWKPRKVFLQHADFFPISSC
jgi:hypothetical protein